MIRRVVVTRPTGPYAGGRKLALKLAALSYEVFELPLLRCVSIPLSIESQEIIQAASGRGKQLWFAFLSPTAVWVWKELVEHHRGLSELTRDALVAVQGSGTADALVECFGRSPNFMPSVFVAEEFARELAARLTKEQLVIAPQSAEGRDVFVPTLLARGWQAVGIKTYRLGPEPIAAETLAAYRSFVRPDTAIVFMSPSAVGAAASAIGPTLGTDNVISVGPITSQALRKAGFPVWREAREHSEDGVLAALQS